MYLAGDGLEELSPRGEPVVDDDFLLLLNAAAEAIPFLLPDYREEGRWHLLVNTAEVPATRDGTIHPARSTFELEGRSLALFMLPRARTDA